MNNKLNEWQEKTHIYLAEIYALECIILSLRFHFIRVGGGGIPQDPSRAYRRLNVTDVVLVGAHFRNF